MIHGTFQIPLGHRIVLYGLFPFLYFWFAAFQYSKSPKCDESIPPHSNDKSRAEIKALKPNGADTESQTAKENELEFYKEFYFKLQNLEDFPETKRRAQELFTALLSQALRDFSSAEDKSILSLGHFDKDDLAKFMQCHQERISTRYEEYIRRRQTGGPRELFQNRQDAGEWLREIAPLKLVDGAWLGHLNTITMPFALRSIIKQTWQVFIEELGNGSADQHHVKIFEDLLRNFEPDLPSPTSRAVLHPRFQLGSVKYWRAAVAQLLVSLSPHEYFPEILGFNMHFECLQLDTLQAAKELPEVGLSADYFLLHVSIDNNHSGHAAMAMESVIDYIEHVAQTEGRIAADVAWKRVQAGYVLSEWQSREASLDLRKIKSFGAGSLTRLESNVLAIFDSKIHAAHRLHCASAARIGGRTLSEWLDPDAFSREEWQHEFIRSLRKSKPWVYPGDSQKSRLAKELRWGGKMYGAFTKAELDTLDLWIEILGQKEPFYITFIKPTDLSLCQNSVNAVLSEKPPSATSHESSVLRTTYQSNEVHGSNSLVGVNLSLLLPLWFTQCCLLESYLYAPGRSTDVIGCAIVRFLRAQFGYEAEDAIVTGTHEPRSAENGGLVEIGFEIIQRASLSLPKDLGDVLACWPCSFATEMLELASKPVQNLGLLLGMSAAFVEMQERVSEFPNSTLLGPQQAVRLAWLARRQYQCLRLCFDEITTNHSHLRDYQRGYNRARGELQKCFEAES